MVFLALRKPTSRWGQGLDRYGLTCLAMTSRLTLSVIAAATFLAGFGAAELTGVRAVGGVVLLAGGVWCVRLALRLAAVGPTVALIAIALGLFILSHPLGRAIGAWPAVLVSAALLAGAAGAITNIWPKNGSRTADGPERRGCVNWPRVRAR